MPRFFLSEGDLVFARTGASVGKSYRYDKKDGPLVFAGFLIRISPDPEKLEPAFLAYCVQSRRYWEWVATMSIRSGQPGINGQEYAMFQIPLPPPSEQRAIAEALSDVDGLLAALEALIAKKRAIKQATMQQLLTSKTRLPGFSGEWETTTVGEVADIRNGATPSTQIGAYWNGPIPWCTPTDITATPGKYLCATERSITAMGLANCAASLLPVGALLLCSRATIGEIKIAVSSVCTNQGFKSLVCKDGVSNEFLYYLLLTLKPQMIERAIGSTFLEIGKRDVTSIELCIPTYAEQCAIATVLSDMDAEIAVLERRRDKTRAVKQGMMQQLLTGRVRLVQLSRSTEEAAC
ncbi:MAG: restriction endonuclease subunit S [Nitrospira sp.]|nr:restriction endonuclease subunit S [Nitrospira sp.]